MGLCCFCLIVVYFFCSTFVAQKSQADRTAMLEKFKFTKKVLQDITQLEKRKRYYDSDVAGLVCV